MKTWLKQVGSMGIFKSRMHINEYEVITSFSAELGFQQHETATPCYLIRILKNINLNSRVSNYS